MQFIAKLLNANRHAKSRLHDEKGNFVGWAKAIRHGIPAFTSGLMRLAVGYRPKLPWIAYDAIDYFERTISKESRILEFGSGMSTIWYAERAGSVVSIEDCRPWYEKVQKLLKDNGLGHVDYRFAGDRHSYCDFDAIADSEFDLIVVDGSYRDECAGAAIRLVHRGGAIYLDNSDRSAASNQPAMVIAEKTLRDFASRVGAEIVEITDFAPTQLFVNQGILLKVPA